MVNISGKNMHIILSLLLMVKHATPYSGGAPESACLTMTPGHGATPQSSSAPFDLSTNATVTEGGRRIFIQLKGAPDAFKGFFIQGRSMDGGDPLGRFVSDRYRLVSCNRGVNNAITHGSSANRQEISVEWEAPLDVDARVQFRAAVVKDFDTYWTGLTSSEVTVQKRSVSERPLPPTAAAPQPTPALQDSDVESHLSNLYEGCGESKSCSGSPPNCEEAKNCDYLVSFTNARKGWYEFELMGSGSGNRYVAAGLSFDERMGDDSVMVCGSSSLGVDVFMTWNNGRANENILKPKEGLRPIVGGVMDGKIYCKFERREVTRPKNKIKFDLKNDKFHILVAQGSLLSDNRLSYHGDDKISSSQPLALGITKKVGQRDTRFFKMIHGCVMIGAWICAASCGILFARYFKQTWLDFKCCNLDQWFHFHRLFMMVTWSASIAGLVLIVYELGDFRVTNHSLIGIVSIALCFIQPFMAALRPHPSASSRSFFNCLHWFVGNSAQILGVAAIFLGFELFLGSGRNWVKEVAWALLVIFIAFHCLSHLVLSISQCCSDRKPKNSDVFPLKDFAGSRSLLQPEKVSLDAPYGCFRKFVLALYLPVNWIVTVLLMLLVIFKREEIEQQLTEWNIPKFWEDL